MEKPGLISINKANINTFKSLTIPLLIILISLGVVAIFRQFSVNKNISNALATATTIKTPAFTELYFEDHTSLPTSASTGELASFPFTIHNLENQKFTYLYEIYLEEDQKKTVIHESSLELSAGEYKTIQIMISPTNPIKRAKVVVNLKNKNQQIQFWLKGNNE